VQPKPSKLLLALLFSGVLMGALDLAIIGPALPAIKAEFGMPDRQLAILLNAYILCQLLGTPLLAKLSDRFGPRAIYIFSIACFAAGSLVLVVADSANQLFAGRALQGFGAGGIFPVASAVIAAELPDEERGPALGILGAVFGLAFLIGPVLGGILLQFSWQWLFMINLPIAVVLIAGAIIVLPAKSRNEPQPFDFTGAALLAIGLTTLVLAVNNIDTGDVPGSFLSWKVGGAFLVTAIVTPWFWRTEKRVADPIIKPDFFASRQILLACIISAGIGAMQSGGIFAPALIVSSIGITASNAAWLLIPGVVLSTIASPIAGRLVNRIGSRSVILVSLLFVLGSVLIYALTDMSIFKYVLASMLSGLGMAGLLGAPLRFIVLRETGPGDHASGQGLLSVASSIGRLLGAAIVGSIATSAGGGTVGYQSAFISMVVLGAMLFIVAWFLQTRSTKNPTKPITTGPEKPI
jgi:EmrB/QacA subfamily drug resistance transporter